MEDCPEEEERADRIRVVTGGAVKGCTCLHGDVHEYDETIPDFCNDSTTNANMDAETVITWHVAEPSPEYRGAPDHADLRQEMTIGVEQHPRLRIYSFLNVPPPPPASITWPDSAFKWIPAHVDVPKNVVCDKLARFCAERGTRTILPSASAEEAGCIIDETSETEHTQEHHTRLRTHRSTYSCSLRTSLREMTSLENLGTKIDAVSLVVEFLEVAIHGVLFYRKIYPEGIFTLKKKYGVPVHISLYPDLNKYINETLFVIKKVLESGQLMRVDICFYDSTSLPIEKVVFKFDAFDKSGDVSVVDPYLLNLRECFRAFILKLSVSTSYVAALPYGTTFKILIHTTESTAILVNEDPNFQQFPLVEAMSQETSLFNTEIVPLRRVIRIWDALKEDNKKLEAESKKLEKELKILMKEDPSNEKAQHLDTEGYRQFVEQVKIKEALKKQIGAEKERLRILIESRTDITEMNVDALSQAELIRIVKQLERRKVDAQSKLHGTEQSLNSTAKEVAKLRDAQKMYQTEFELRDRKRGTTRMQR
ncbi:hypothetical protein GE061_016056 [Apolygus lucorum]|uniref:HORMA domain-containing protein n=1 Tax=Apolygus lucorum TaxID=248454 RepID=A0A8S9XG99_APOLU|nr:hypothetical protein GE061_016056 [Apolygus lucorum]